MSIRDWHGSGETATVNRDRESRVATEALRVVSVGAARVVLSFAVRAEGLPARAAGRERFDNARRRSQDRHVFSLF